MKDDQAQPETTECKCTVAGGLRIIGTLVFLFANLYVVCVVLTHSHEWPIAPVLPIGLAAIVVAKFAENANG